MPASARGAPVSERKENWAKGGGEVHRHEKREALRCGGEVEMSTGERQSEMNSGMQIVIRKVPYESLI